MLLNYLYPEMESQWIAIDKGTFYRNYNQDALSIDEKEKKVVLARDGFLRLLPDGLLLDQKLTFLLKSYFGFDINKESNALVKEAAILLPFVSRWRGDLGFVANLLGALMNCEVEMTKGRYSHQDTTRNWLPVVRYKLLIPGLTAEQFKMLKVDLVPLGDFLKEWFVPFEVRCEIDVKEHSQPQNPDGRLTLNYNTELNQ